MKRRIRLALVLLALSLPAPRVAAADIDAWELAATDVLTGVVPLGALWLTYDKDDGAGREQYLWSMGTTLVVINGARLAFNEHEWGTRPNGHPYGFPSGHLAFFGAGAAFLQDRYGWRWGVPAWAGAAYTAYVRVEDDHHRWRDVAVSSAFAFASSKYFVSRYPDTTVKPLVDLRSGWFGLQVQYQW